MIGEPVAHMVVCWSCNWKIAGSNLGFEGPFGTIVICSASCTVPVFRGGTNRGPESIAYYAGL